MNKTIIMGRLVREAEVKYSQGDNPMAVVRYTLAVNRKFKKDGEPDADFINCIAFGKGGEFVSKYFKKGQLVSVVGSIRTGSYEDKDGKKVYTTDVVTDEHYFAESKGASSEQSSEATQTPKAKSESKASNEGFVVVDELDSDDLPF